MSGIENRAPTEEERNAAPLDEATQLRRALTTIRRLRAQLEEQERARTEPLAIVGIALRVPGANTVANFWNNLLAGVDSTSDLPDGRWNAEAYLSDDRAAAGTMPSRHGGFITSADQFDAEFFGISPREAEQMDPQQRLLLMTTWEALEDAGIPPERLSGSDTGVFLGIGLNDYGRLQAPRQHAFPQTMDSYAVSGNVFCIAANRISYILNLHGPSLAIDTACSSSLVSLHQAIRSLRQGECTVALAGGSNLILAPENSVGLRGFLSPEGRCKFGDASADGFGRGEGVIMTVVTTLAHAREHNLRVYALVRGSAINQDGFSSGLTVPNGLAQQAMLEHALRDARLAPADVAYIEAHGTGTRLGDPIEVQALGSVLGKDHNRNAPLYVGSVKSNIGHLEAAAGIAGVVKTALALYHGVIPRSLHYTTPNPFIDFDGLGVQVVSHPLAWNESVGRRIAGVSSFGFGGVNAHVLLEGESAIAQPFAATREPTAETPADRTAHLLALSAKTDAALRAVAQRHLQTLSIDPAPTVADYAYSANTGRSHLPRRLAIAATNRDEMLAALQAFVDGEENASLRQSQPSDTLDAGAGAGAGAPVVAFLFTGQGAQYAGMARGLYAADADFRADIDHCIQLAASEMDIDLAAALFAGADDAAIHQTRFTQPALFAIEYALARQWMRWGIQPAALLGHSLGEYAAAVIAGVFSLEDGMRLVAARATLMQQLPADGAMAAIFAPLAAVEAVIAPEKRVAIAAYNGHDHVVISGDAARVGELIAMFEAKGDRTRRLATSHAFHSPLIEPMQAAFRRVAEGVVYKSPTLPLLSNVTGAFWAEGSAPDANYWTEHLRQPVRFAQGIAAIHASECNLFIEIGPAPVLVGMASRILPEETLLWLPSLRKGSDDWATMLTSLSACYTAGATLDWRAFDRPWRRARVALPTYPFQTERYWFDQPNEIAPSPSATAPAPSLRPLIDRRIHLPNLSATIVESELSLARQPWLNGHRAAGNVIFPATAFVELLREAAELSGITNAVVQELLIRAALPIPDDGAVIVQTTLDAADSGRWSATIHAANLAPASTPHSQPEWTQVATALLLQERGGEKTPPVIIPENTIPEIASRMTTTVAPAEFYRQMTASQMEYSGHFQSIGALWHGDREALARIAPLPESEFLLAPALLDAALQPLALLYGTHRFYLPISVEGVHQYALATGEVWSHVTLTKGAAGDEMVECALRLYDGEGNPVAAAERIVVRQAIQLQRSLQPQPALQNDFYQPAWREQPLEDATTSGPTRWIIFAESATAGTALTDAARLGGDEATCFVAPPHSEGMPSTAECMLGAVKVVDLLSPKQVRETLASSFALSRQSPANTAAHTALLLLFDRSPTGAHAFLGNPEAATQQETYPTRAQNAVVAALHLVQAASDHATGTGTGTGIGTVRVYLATTGAQQIHAPEVGDPALAALAGFARVAQAELPDLHCTTVDLDPTLAPADALTQLLAEVRSASNENEVSWRAGTRFVRRLQRLDIASAANHNPQKVAVVGATGAGEVALAPLTIPQPAAGEVVIEVRALGVNFRDVLITLGMYPETSPALGNECAGVVIATGAGVSQWQVGDEVIALATGCMATHAVVSALLCVHKPASLSWATCASIPIAYLTAHYALIELAGLKKGDRVLIHAAAGGVGLAAVAIAQSVGAIVHATAGSEEKRALLHSLGVQHLYGSRTLDFAEEIRRDTGGWGVDVILNSLSGDFIPASLGVLHKGGVFLEIGKRGIWSAAEVANLDATARYEVIYLGGVYAERPAYVAGLLQGIVDQIVAGSLRPLPLAIFPLHAAQEAFLYMAHARHVGKIVLDPSHDANRVRPDAAYLVTGGLGGIGLAIARDLAARGARHLILCGRSTPNTAAQATIDDLRNRGVAVDVKPVDIASWAEVQRLFVDIDSLPVPLRGIVHAAGVLEDGSMLLQNAARIHATIAPKVFGAWNLHRATLSLPLDFALYLSAGATLLGMRGQGGYCAANAFLDEFAHARRALGHPAVSINLGAWEGAGMRAALSADQRTQMNDDGILGIAPEAGLAALQQALQANLPQVAILPMAWDRFFARTPQQRATSLLAEISATASHTAGDNANPAPAQKQTTARPPAFREQWQHANTGERSALIKTLVRQQIGKILRLPEARVLAPKQPLVEIGFDSLMAVELRNSLRTALQVHLPTTLLFDFPTPDALTHYLGAHLEAEFGNGEPSPSQPPTQQTGAPATRSVSALSAPSAGSATLAEIQNMSDDEAEQLLLQELEALQGERKS